MQNTTDLQSAVAPHCNRQRGGSGPGAGLAQRVAEPTPIKYYLCDKVRFFNSQTSAGVLIQGYGTSVSKKASELPTDIEDISFLAL